MIPDASPPVSCPATPTRQRGYVFDSDSSNNITRTSRCATGYEGTPSDVTCRLTNGTWSSATGCVPVQSDCSSQLVTTVVGESHIDSCQGECTMTNQGETCVCDAGFTQADTNNDVCQAN